MSISFDGALEVINLDVEDLVGLSEEQIKGKFEEKLPDLSSSELETFMEELRERLSEIEDELEALQDGYADDLDDAEDDDRASSVARYEAKLEEVNEALELLDDIDDIAEEVIEHETLLNPAPTSEDYYFSYDTNDLNQTDSGDEFNITLTGTRGTTGLDWDDEEDEEELTDVNGDGFITYADKEAQAADSTTSFEGQDFFFAVNPGDTVELVSSNGNVATFQITTSEGKTLTVNIEGDVNIYFEGTNYVDMDAISSWPEELQERCFDNSDTMSFYDRLNEDEMSLEDRLAYIDGYEDVMNQETLNKIWADQYADANAHNIDNGTIKSASQATEYYQDAITKLYEWIDDTSSSKESISTVWAEIFADWQEAGLNDFDFSTLIMNIVMGVSISGDSNTFNAFFAPVITTLEGYFKSSSTDNNTISTLEKMVITLLETQCKDPSTGSSVTGLYGGPDIWTYAYAHEEGTGDEVEMVDGVFTDNDENVEVIDLYNDFVFSTGWMTNTGSEQSALENEEETVEANQAANDPNATTELSDEETISLKDELQGIYSSITSNKYWYGTWLGKEEWDEAVGKLMNKLFDGDGNLVSNPKTAFKQVMDEMCKRKDNGKYKKDWADNLASGLLVAIDTECPELSKLIFKNDKYGIVQFLYNITKYDEDDYDGKDKVKGDKPALYDEATSVWRTYT